jgi:RNA polymerase sigma factor (sigma-70 family)
MDPRPPQPENFDEPAGEDTARLARGARGGDQEQFNALYERLAPALYTWAELRIGPRLRAWLEPADLVQEVWLRALRGFGSFDPATTSFRYWAFRIAKNALLEALRKSESPARGTWQAAASLRPDPLAQVPDSVTGVSRRLARSEDLECFRSWVQVLEGNDRELVIHIGLEGLGHAQVARRLGLEPKTVTKRWQRLRERLEEQGSLLEILEE